MWADFHDTRGSDTEISQGLNAQPVIWNKLPIPIAVSVGQERLITFPTKVVVHNIDPNLTTDKVSILNSNGTLYIKALSPFEAITLPVELESGEVVLLSVSGQAGGQDNTPIQVLLPEQPHTSTEQASNHGTATVNYADLTRFAIESAFYPPRLLEKNNAIARTPMYTTKTVNLVANSNLIAMPSASWKWGDLYITEVILKNPGSRTEVIDPRFFIGNWLAASPFPTNYVTPVGTLHDTTTYFLISEKPFNRALNEMKEVRSVK